MNGTAESACLLYKHMYLPDGAIRGAAVALNKHRNSSCASESVDTDAHRRTHTVQSCVGVFSLAVCRCPFPCKTHLVGQQRLDLSQLYILQLIHLPAYHCKPTCPGTKERKQRIKHCFFFFFFFLRKSFNSEVMLQT